MNDRKITIRTFENATKGLLDFCQYIKNEIGQNIKICEIGSFAGDSSEIFALNLFDFCSDIKKYNMDDVEKQFDEVLNTYHNIKKIKYKSEEACKLFSDNYFDVIYIDAIHQYDPVKLDIINWLPKIKKYGFIAGHDYDNKFFPGVKQAIDELLISPDKVFLDSSWIKRII